MSIKIVNLSKAYPLKGGFKPVFSGINVEIGNGEILALTGRNGSGKTTLLKVLSTLVLPTQGTAELNGIDILLHPVTARGIIGFVNGAEHGFYQALSLKDNLMFYGRIRGMDTRACGKKISELVELLALTEWVDMPVSKCSSGIKQRAGIARALLSAPAVLLIDELSRSIDDVSRNDIKMYIRKYVSGSGGSCILVTHDKAETRGFRGQGRGN